MSSSGSAPSASSQPFHWRELRLELLAERALWEPSRRLLLVADLHLGKAETFQAQGIPLPSDGDGNTLNALLSLVQRRHPTEVVVLGDLIHSRLGLTAELRQKLRALPELMACRLRLIGGNHDQGSWLEGLIQEPPQAMGALWLSHEPDPRPGLLNICGHCHPVALIGHGADLLRLPCFAFSPRVDQLVLPAFGHLTGGHPCRGGERLWPIAEGSVVAWPVPAPGGMGRRRRDRAA